MLWVVFQLHRLNPEDSDEVNEVNYSMGNDEDDDDDIYCGVHQHHLW